MTDTAAVTAPAFYARLREQLIKAVVGQEAAADAAAGGHAASRSAGVSCRAMYSEYAGGTACDSSSPVIHHTSIATLQSLTEKNVSTCGRRRSRPSR